MVLSIFFIALGLLLFVTGPFTQRQELRKAAMKAGGLVTLSFTPEQNATFTINQPQVVDIKLNTNNHPTLGVQLIFDVITNETIDDLAVNFVEASGLNQAALEVKRVGHGYTVRFIGLPKSVSDQARYTTNTPTSILQLRFTPKKAGSLGINFNKPLSKVNKADTQQLSDELNLVENFEYIVKSADIPPNPTATPTPTATPQPPNPPTTTRDDLFFANLSNSASELKFYKTDGSNSEVSINKLVPNTQYKIKLTSKIQNNKKNVALPEQPITVEVNINTTTKIRNSEKYSTLRAQSDGVSVTLEGNFTAQQKNKYVVTIDPDNTLAEVSETNNSWQTEVAYEAPSSTTKSCNDTCSSNSECPSGQRCFTTGSESRCRLATNVTSTSCTQPPDQGLRRSCDEYCADTRECSAGLTCWYNKCRLLENLESRSCRVPQATTGGTGGPTKGGQTTGTAVVYQGCNENCQTNRDCTSGLRCYQSKCRHPLQVTSTSCSTTETTTTPKPSTTPTTSSKPTASPKSSVSPTARPSIAPTPSPILTTTQTPPATPSATPTAAPESTPLTQPQTTGGTPGFFSNLGTTSSQFITTTFGSFLQFGTFYGMPVPYLVIGLGVVFLVIALIVMLMSSKKHVAPPVVPVVQTKPNPTPPSQVLARRGSPDPTLLQSLARPPQPTAPPAPVSPLAVQKSMTAAQPLTQPQATQAVQPQTNTSIQPVVQQARLSQQKPLDTVLQELKDKRQAAPTSPLPAQTPVAPAPSRPTTSPEELLKQDADNKMTMADRLKLKGVEFKNNN